MKHHLQFRFNQKEILRVLLVLFQCVLIAGPVSYGQVCKAKDLPYLDSTAIGFSSTRHTLDVFFAKDTLPKKPVVVFIHGGSWKNGKKNTYRLMARNFVKKGFVCVLINYRLSPETDYKGMAEDCAHAVHWVHENILRYGGDVNAINLTGHSAGGHLAAFITLSDTFKDLGYANPVYKTILIDPFGLDMLTYFNGYKNKYAISLFPIFTKDPDVWRAASPLYKITDKVAPPFLVLTGSRTFPAIMESSLAFTERLKRHGVVCVYNMILGKKHIGMITQFFLPCNKTYPTLIRFMRNDL